MITLAVGNSHTQVVDPDPEPKVHELINRACTLTYDFWIRRRGMPRPKRDSRELCYYVDGKFPTGWLNRVISRALERSSVEYEVVDEREYPKVIDLEISALPDDPWEHQTNALKAAEEHERGIIQVPTRGGKTLIMGLCAGRFSTRTLVLVPNKLLLAQEYDVFCKIFGEDKVGRVGSGYDDYDKPLIVASVQTMHRRIKQARTQELFDTVGCLLIDECHHIKHGGYKLRNTYFDIVQGFNQARYRLGFTATPGKTDSLERRFLEAATGKMIFHEDISTLTRKGIITPARVLIVPKKLPKTRTLRDILEEDHGLLTERGEEPERVFLRNNIPIPHTPGFSEQLKEKVTENPKIRKLVKDLAEYYAHVEKKTVIVAVSRVEQGTIAYTEGDHAIEGAVALSGKAKDAEREQILGDFKAGKIPILVSTLLREGIDIPKADVLIMASADIKSATPVIQKAGRVLTRDKGKELAIIIDFYLQDKGTLRKHSRERMILYEQQGWEIEVLDQQSIKRIRQAAKARNSAA